MDRPTNVTQKLFQSKIVDGKMEAGKEIGIKGDQILLEDASGVMAMLECEAMHLDTVHAEIAVQYIDHNLLQADCRNAEDHAFLFSGCQKWGIWYSGPSNGVSHPVHMERFGIPGKSLIGADSHTCAAGSLGMLAIGAGGLEVAVCMAGEPFYLVMPKVWGIKLTGKLPPWVSAKDLILELLRRHGVEKGLGYVLEFYGPGLKCLSAMDRHVLANMGAELGAVTTVFPSDQETLRFLKSQRREDVWYELIADEGAEYDEYETVDLSTLEPLVALPGSPGNVVPVREVAGLDVYQCYIGSSANPGIRDFAVPAKILENKHKHPRVSLDINAGTRQVLENLAEEGLLNHLLHAGARLHESGCNGCIGMGQVPVPGRVSLRTVPRNFPARSGVKGDLVYLCSPETAAASALTGVITDPRTLSFKYPAYKEKDKIIINTGMLVPPPSSKMEVELVKGPNIKKLPHFPALKQPIEGPVVIKVEDDISTDTILHAGSDVMPILTDVDALSHFLFKPIDDKFWERAIPYQKTGSVIVAGNNYGQGSSREHAALCPRYLGVEAVLAKSYARIHWQNLVSFGILPLCFKNSKDYGEIELGDVIHIADVHQAIHHPEKEILVTNITKNNATYQTYHHMSPRQIKILLAGGLMNSVKRKRTEHPLQ